MKCANCGFDIGLSADVCLKCGLPVKSSQDDTVVDVRPPQQEAVAGHVPFGPASDIPSRREGSYPWLIHGVRTGFVGRDQTLQTLHEILKQAIQNRSVEVVTLVGEVGMGKSRLLNEFNRFLDLRQGDVHYVPARVREEWAAGYALFQRLIRNRFYILDTEKGAHATQKLLEGIRYLIKDPDRAEEMTHLIGFLVGFPLPHSRFVDIVAEQVSQIRCRAYEALCELLTTDASRNPLVLAFDNMERADHESLNLIQYLRTSLKDCPVLVICAGQPLLLQPLADTDYDVLLRLEPLSEEETRQLVGEVLQQADTPIPEDLYALILRNSGGNPLMVEEIVRYLVDLEIIDVSTPRWSVDTSRLHSIDMPLSLKGVVSARLQSLTAEEKQLLERAATVGTTFWFGALLTLERMEAHRAGKPMAVNYSDVENSTRVLKSLVEKDIIKELTDTDIPGEPAARFKFPIEREGILEGLKPKVRQRYHRLIGQWLELNVREHLDDYLETIGYHLEQGGDHRGAAQFFVQVAEQARIRYLNRKAIAIFERALRLLGEEDVVRKLEIHHDIGTVFSLVGEYSQALSHFQEMLRLSWLVESRSKAGVAYNKLGRTYREIGEYGTALDNLSDSLKFFDSVGDTRGIAACQDDIGKIHWLRGELDKALEYYEKSLSCRRELGDKQSIGLSLNNIGNVWIDKGDFKRAVTYLREALDIRRKIGDRPGVSRTLSNLACVFYDRGRVQQSIELWKEALHNAREIGDTQAQSILLNNIGESLITIDQNGDAESFLKEALKISEGIGDRRPRADALVNLGRIYAARDDLDAAEQCTMQSLELSKEMGSKRGAGRAYRALGDIYAKTLFDEQAEGGTDGAEGSYLKSIELLREGEFEAELGKTLFSFGNRLIEQGRSDQGIKLLREALDIFGRLEMVPLLQRTQRILKELSS